MALAAILAFSSTPAATVSASGTADVLAVAGASDGFVFETLDPTPKADPMEVWRTNHNPLAPYHPCGSYEPVFRFAVPPTIEPGQTYLVNLRRNVRPWGGGFPPYTLVVRTDAPGGPVAWSAPLTAGNAYLDLTGSISPAHRAQGYVDLYPTVLCDHGAEGWTWTADSDWGYWDVEAYLLPAGAHRLGIESAVVYYRYGFPRLDDLAKHDLVVLAATYPWFGAQYATLRSRGTLVAGYLSTTLDPRCGPPEPAVGDGAGPGGFDSRYVDLLDASRAPLPDGFPDSFGATAPSAAGMPHLLAGTDRGTGGAGRTGRTDAAADCRWFQTDPGSSSWQAVMVGEAGRHLANGANALFLDGFEAVHPSIGPGLRGAVLALRAAFPGVPVIVNSYAGFFGVADLVNAVLMESFTYAYGGVRIDPALDGIRDDQARDANALRGDPSAPAFDLLALDEIAPYDASDKVDAAIARAASNGMIPATWDMVLVSPANNLVAKKNKRGFKVTWAVARDVPTAEAMSSVASYQLRRLSRPFSSDADWDAAAVVATLGPGARAFLDRGPPPTGPVYYALRAFRTGASARVLLGTPTVQAR